MERIHYRGRQVSDQIGGDIGRCSNRSSARGNRRRRDRIAAGDAPGHGNDRAKFVMGEHKPGEILPGYADGNPKASGTHHTELLLIWASIVTELISSNG